MQCEGTKETTAEAARSWAFERARPDTRPDWQTVDRALRAIRHRRAALDAEEMHWLRAAETLQIWRPLGMVSVFDYLERVLGYAPRTAQDRLRVARALGILPKLSAALADNELPYSAVRELTRVAVPATETAWISAAIGKNLRQIEELVADHRQGDRPDDPPNPEARTHVVRFELAAETFALLRQARVVLADEHGANLTDDEFVAALCNSVLDGAATTVPTGRAKFQIAMTVCQRCRQGWQEGGGSQIPVDSTAVERAMCDAQHIGSIDGSVPERAYQDIPPSVVRFVWHRDGGRCRVDGCRSTRGLELHHIVHRADGGSHDVSNIALVCSACHLAHHRGTLTIAGTAEHLVVHRPGQPASAATVCDPPDKMDATADVHAHADADSGRDVRTHLDMGSTVAVHHIDAGTPVTSDTRSDVAEVAEASMEANMARRVQTSIANVDAHVDAAHVGAASGAPVEPSVVGLATRTTPVVDSEPTVDSTKQVAPVTSRSAHVGAVSRLDAAILRTQAKAALTGLGWKPVIAHAAVATAFAEAQDMELTLERLIFEALRRCPLSKA